MGEHKEHYVYTTPDGVEYKLNNNTDKFVHSVTGLGMAPANFGTTTGPFQHGESLANIKLKPRTVRLTVRHNGCNRDEYWTIRENLVDMLRYSRTNMFNPEVGQLRYSFYRDGAMVHRAVDCVLSEGLVFEPEPMDRWDSFSIQESLAFTCFDPVIYDPTDLTYTLPDPDESLILPHEYCFGLGTWVSEGSITYSGTWLTYPSIVITGPAENPAILNTTTGKSLRLEYDVPAGGSAEFDLRFDKKTVVDQDGNSLLGYLRGSDIGEFAILPDPLVAGGVNELLISFTGYDPDSTSVVFSYHNRFIGI